MRRGVTRREFISTSVAAATSLLSDRSLAQATDSANLSIAQASRLIRSRDLPSAELVQAYLDRIASVDSRLNAFITVMDEEASIRARALDRELANGNWRGPLHGIPIALKDNIDTAGVLTTAASAVFADRVPTSDAAVVTRLEDAGAIVLGKLNMHEFAYGADSTISHFGSVHNPWGLERIAGGSSGGAAAAVAARLCAGALGTDTGGSIRNPAARCGVVGLKPTYGLISIRGIIPLSVSLDHVGPICRTAEDAALLLQALAGYDPLDIPSIRADVPNYRSGLQRGAQGLRLGVPRTPFYEDLDPQVGDVVEHALGVLTDLAVSAQDVELPPMPDVPPVFVESYAYHLAYLETKQDLYAPSTLARIKEGANHSATEYAESLYQLELSRKAIAAVFEEVDVLVTPTLTHLPTRIEETIEAISEPRDSPLDVDLMVGRNTAPFNVYGIPTISMPCGFSREGWPIGVQISGRPLGELDVLRLAYAYQQATDWHERVPHFAG